MSTGALLTLLSNDGKLDSMLTADGLLSEHLSKVRQARRSNPRYTDDTPSLVDIEQTHILFVNAHFKPYAALAYEYQKTRNTAGNPQLGGNVQFSIQQFGEFINDMVLHIVLDAPTLTQGSVPTPGQDEAYFRYFDYVGEQLVYQVSFEVNGNKLDEYDAVYNVMYRQLLLGSNKISGWNRCVGQENALRGYENQSTTVVQAYRREAKIFNGFQTPSISKTTALEIFMPLHFWFRDPRVAFPSVAVPAGQRLVNVTLASFAQILAIVTRGVGSGATLSVPNVSTMELFVNNIFVTKEVHDIYIKRVGFNLIRLHLHHTDTANAASMQIQLTRLKFPVESLFVGILLASQASNPTKWHKFTQVTDTAFGATVTAPVEARLMTNMQIIAHGIPLYQSLGSEFYNSYIPLNYGGYNLNTPSDTGLNVVTFCLYPGSYQPSGHINTSRAREFFIQFASTIINSGTTGTLHVYATCLNILMIADGSAILRYTT